LLLQWLGCLLLRRGAIILLLWLLLVVLFLPLLLLALADMCTFLQLRHLVLQLTS
jgi:hypothetical protein